MKIGGDFNCFGNKNISEQTFPNLTHVGGNLIIAQSGFTKLPSTLEHVGGNVIIPRADPPSLLNMLIRAKKNNIIKGDLMYCD